MFIKVDSSEFQGQRASLGQYIMCLIDRSELSQIRTG